jgi:hypothetical protein
VHATWIELNSNLIEEEWDANWYIKHWKHACDFGVGRENKNFEKLLIQKYIFPFLENSLKMFQFGTPIQKDNLWNLKVALPKLSLKWIIVIEISKVSVICEHPKRNLALNGVTSFFNNLSQKFKS